MSLCEILIISGFTIAGLISVYIKQNKGDKK